ncbi:MAG: NfeD family protein [Dehalococcoidales bacterium]|jgi:membrane-bound ClpP family serine protease
MNKKLTSTRLVLAIISNTLELTVIWIIWRFVLPEFGVELPVPVFIGIMVVWAVIGAGIFIFTSSVLKKQAPVGLPSMVGTTGKAATPLTPDGMVKIRGELWAARAAGDAIADGESIIVTGQEGLKLLVGKVDGTAKH